MLTQVLFQSLKSGMRKERKNGGKNQTGFINICGASQWLSRRTTCQCQEMPVASLVQDDPRKRQPTLQCSWKTEEFKPVNHKGESTLDIHWKG